MVKEFKTPPTDPESFLRHWFTTTMTPLRLDFYKDLETKTAEVTLEFSRGQITRLLEKLRELTIGLKEGGFKNTATINESGVQRLISLIESLDYQNRVLTPEEIESVTTEFDKLFPQGSHLL